MTKFRDYVSEEKESLTEGFFGTIMGTVKLSSDIKKYVKDITDSGDNKNLSDDEKLDKFREAIDGALKIIDASKIDDEFKDNFRVSFLSGVGRTINKLTGKSPSDWNEKLKLDSKTYDMLLKGTSKK